MTKLIEQPGGKNERRNTTRHYCSVNPCDYLLLGGALMNEFETAIDFVDFEVDATVSFDYQPAEPQFFNHTQGIGDPGCEESVTITGCVVSMPNGLIVDMFTPEHDARMTSAIIASLESKALEHKHSEREELIELLADIAEQSKEYLAA